MREGQTDLEAQELKLILARMDNATSNVKAVFDATCTKILHRKKIEGFRPPFEVVIGCGGLSTKLAYWLTD